MALGLADDAGLVRDVEPGLWAGAHHETGGAAADVDHDGRRAVVGVAFAGRAKERQLGLLVAGQDMGPESVAVVDGIGELPAVGCVADGAGQHRLRPVGTLAVDQSAELLERVVHPLHGLVCQPSRGVQTLAQPGHGGAPLEARR